MRKGHEGTIYLTYNAAVFHGFCQYVQVLTDDSDIEIDHLIAFKLFIGNYRFHPLQDQLLKCLHSVHGEDNYEEERLSLYHWKISLEAAFVRFNAFRISRGVNETMLFDREMTVECALKIVFGQSK